MILVTGATGNLGKLTIKALLKKNAPAVGALVRNTAKATILAEKGVEVRTGDYFDYPALLKAFAGVDTLLLVSSATFEKRVEQHTNVINAAKEAGVQHIVYTSMLKTSDTSKFTAGIDHYHTEQYLKKAGIPYTVLRNTFYFEVLPMLLGDTLQSGNWFYAAGDAKANFAARTDMAEALATVLLRPLKHQNKIYEITSTKAYSFNEIAEVLSKAVGKQITYTPIPVQALKEGMHQAGVPDIYIPVMASIAEAIGGGELDVTDVALENLLGRKPADLKDYLQNLLNNAN